MDPVGQAAFVTGGAAGIGLGIARALLDAGASVAIADVREDALAEAVRRLDGGERVFAARLDVSSRDQYPGVVDAAEAALGPIGILCNNAGIGVTGPIKDSTYGDWDWLRGVMLDGVVNGIMTVLPRMRARGRGGHIVNTSSMAGLFRAGEAGIYATMKYAVTGMAEALRAELEPEGIGVSVFVPGPTRTDIYWSHRLRPQSLVTGYAGVDADRAAAGEAIWRNELDPDDLLRDPFVVGERVVEGIRRNDLFIFGHHAFRDGLERRHAALMRAIPDIPIPATMREQARRLNDNPIYDGQAIVPPLDRELPPAKRTGSEHD